jgi:hypothetical protein
MGQNESKSKPYIIQILLKTYRSHHNWCLRITILDQIQKINLKSSGNFQHLKGIQPLQETCSRHSAKSFIFKGTKNADDPPRHHSNDLQHFPHRKEWFIELHSAVLNSFDDEFKFEKIKQTRLLKIQKRTNFNCNRADEQRQQSN